MTQLVAKQTNLRRLEAKLDRQKDPYQRLILLDQLSGDYVFINYRKAQKHLAEQLSILKKDPYPDFQLNYHLNTAIIENHYILYLVRNPF